MSESDDELLAEELFQCCTYDWLSEEFLREIIERHELTHQNNTVSNYKFFRLACSNEKITEGIIQCLLEYFPDAASSADDEGQLPLHYACDSEDVPLGVMQLLIDAAPDSVHRENNNRRLPLHILCANAALEGSRALEILHLLLEKCPESIRHADNETFLPIHIAAIKTKSPEFLRVMIEAYPGSERMADDMGMLPIHYACMKNSIAMVEYFYNLYPDAIHHKTTHRLYPIQVAVYGLIQRADPEAAVDIVKFLLGCDPRVKLQKVGILPSLLMACSQEYHDSNIRAGIEVIKAIYDAHPHAIESYDFASRSHLNHPQVQTFVTDELVYFRQARDFRLLTTPDDNGQLPLHTALQSNVRLGSIKLLVRGFPLAVLFPDNSGALPLHIACAHHESASVVQHLVELDTTTLEAVDEDNNTALHYACRGAKYETIALLLEKYDAVSVSKRNAQKKLPIDLLWESNEVVDRESVEYTGSIFQLVKAYPENVMVMNRM